MNVKNQLILISVAMVMFMEAVDSTIINTSIPMMAHSLHVDPLDLKLALISYLMSLAIFIPISGWLADKYGSYPIFIASVLVFTLSSVGCGFSHHINQLILFRCLQGLGSSMTTPIGRLILLRIYPRHQIISAMSLVIMIASLGSILGPLLGGILTSHFSWPWIFWVNAPFGLVTLIISYLFLPKLPKHRINKLDKPGFVLFGTGLASLTFGLSCLSEYNLPHHIAAISLMCAFILLTLYGQHSKKQDHPIIHLQLYQITSFKIASLSNLWFRIIMGGIPFVLPLLLQLNLHFSPELAGLYMAPIALGVMVMKPATQNILIRHGYKKTLIANTWLTSLSLISFSLITANFPHPWIAVLSFCYGFFLSLHYTALNTLGYSKIQESDLSKATSIVSTIQQVGMSFGVAFTALLLRLLSGHLSQKTQIYLDDFHHCFIILGLLNLLQLPLLRQLSKEDGQEAIQE